MRVISTPRSPIQSLECFTTYITSLDSGFSNRYIATLYGLRSLKKESPLNRKLELKTAEAIASAHESQVINYLRATSLELGLILNFGPKPQVRRLLLDNVRKHRFVRSAGGAI